MGKWKARSRSPKIRSDQSPSLHNLRQRCLAFLPHFGKHAELHLPIVRMSPASISVYSIGNVWKTTSSSESRWTHTPADLPSSKDSIAGCRVVNEAGACSPHSVGTSSLNPSCSCSRILLFMSSASHAALRLCVALKKSWFSSISISKKCPHRSNAL